MGTKKDFLNLNDLQLSGLHVDDSTHAYFIVRVHDYDELVQLQTYLTTAVNILASDLIHCKDCVFEDIGNSLYGISEVQQAINEALKKDVPVLDHVLRHTKQHDE